MSQIYEIQLAWAEMATNPVVAPGTQLKNIAYPIVSLTVSQSVLEIVDGEGTTHTVLNAVALMTKAEVYKARVPRFVDTVLKVIGASNISVDRKVMIEWLRTDGMVLTVGAVKAAAPLVAGFGESDQF